eukprot:TRINITY_DN2197_c0_g1_i1.p1 TRINITY_DN2197_c0_g1~~TRINITY_DN2197_c0_g1_i1.p1  ORF type:complete len:314 (-),score=86.76 TRINITY_DN2197_c0_g1_i1:187-1128(-)
MLFNSLVNAGVRASLRNAGARQESALTSVGRAGFGTANIKQIKTRMKAVTNIAKITKAMKMVAASKMRGDLQRLERGKHFGVGTVQAIMANENYLQKRQLNFPVKKTLVVPITTDRGLCGGINSSIVREVKQLILPNRDAFKVFVLGEKGTSALMRPVPDLLVHSASDLVRPINFPTAASIAHLISTNAEDCDRIVIYYNEFKSAIATIIRKVELLPRKHFITQFKYVVRHEMAEPEKDWAQNYYYELYVAGQLYHAILQNAASEQSARMNAMENASKNATDMLEVLRINYNKVRQAKITVELCEIISGAAAV